MEKILENGGTKMMHMKFFTFGELFLVLLPLFIGTKDKRCSYNAFYLAEA